MKGEGRWDDRETAKGPGVEPGPQETLRHTAVNLSLWKEAR